MSLEDAGVHQLRPVVLSKRISLRECEAASLSSARKLRAWSLETGHAID
ncbi:MAG: hypothetical protein ACLSHJ_05775 [Oscillospiraceae bacterium]